MRRKFLLFLFTLCLLFVAAGLVACGSEDNQENQTDKVDDNECLHQWDEGVITTYPTCLTSGVITYTCSECAETRKEILDADRERHIFVGYEWDETYHWQECRLCGEVVKDEHNFADGSKEDDVDKVLECECGEHTTVGEHYAYQVNFVCDRDAAILVYESQDYSVGGAESSVAYSRSKTGELLKDGEGQVNFEVVTSLGYKVKNLTVEPSSGFKNCKGEEETEREKTYRITKITANLTVYVETEIEALDLPVMVINTLNSAPISDKENYVTCSVSVFNAEEEYCFSEVSAGIRGRGNSTWTMPKKPYRIKFDKKIDLFGNGSAKSWTLIANYSDPSLVRNYLAYMIGAEFDAIQDTTTSVRFVEVYLNGSYDGVYLICEQNQVGETRVNIQDDFSIATNPEDMGYLLEFDDKGYRLGELGDEGKDFILFMGHAYAIKSPDYEDIKEGNPVDFSIYSEYIKDYLNQAWSALTSENYESVSAFIDVDSFAEAYVVNELFNTVDIGWTSFWMYKRENGKLYCGPIWDFDVSSGNCNYHPSSSAPTTLWAKENNVWFSALLEFDEFTQLVAQRLQEYKDTIRTVINDSLGNLTENNQNAFLRNFERWKTLGTYVYPNTEELVAITTWKGQVDYVREWLLDSLEYMLSVYCPAYETENLNL